MTEVKDSQAVAVREAVEVDRVTLRRLAAGEVAEAYQLDYFREYPVTKQSRQEMKGQELGKKLRRTFLNLRNA